MKTSDNICGTVVIVGTQHSIDVRRPERMRRLCLNF